VVSQDGSTVTAAHPAWQSSIAPGQSVTFGFNGAATTAGTHPAPVGFALNGVACG
jgi:chitin-binding protein